MGNIIIERFVPNVESIDALDKALRQALGDKTTGMSTGHSGITVHLTDKATADDDNTARQIVLTHDFNKRTIEQESQLERKRLLEVERAKVADSKATKDEVIAYLLLEIANLRERIGE
jgi:hypothetical protein